MNTYVDLQDIEDNFDQEEQLDSMRYQIIDSNLQETIKFNQSPEQVQRKNNNLSKITRGSFGCSMMPYKSINNSVQSSLQLESGIQNTAQFPHGKKFQQRFMNTNDPNTNNTRLNKKSNLTIATNQESEGEEEPQRVNTQEEMEYFLITLIQEVKKQQEEIERLQDISDRQKTTNKIQLQTNRDLCDVLDQTQHQMMVLAKSNQVLKKKCLSYDTSDKISTFLTAESIYNSKGKENYPAKSNQRKQLQY